MKGRTFARAGSFVVVLLALGTAPREVLAESDQQVPPPAPELTTDGALLLPDFGASFRAPSAKWRWCELEESENAKIYACRFENTERSFLLRVEKKLWLAFSRERAVDYAEGLLMPYLMGYTWSESKAEPSSVPKRGSFKVVIRATGEAGTDKAGKTFERTVFVGAVKERFFRAFRVVLKPEDAADQELMAQLASAWQTGSKAASAPEERAVAKTPILDKILREAESETQAPAEPSVTRTTASGEKRVFVKVTAGVIVLVFQLAGFVAFVRRRRGAQPEQVARPRRARRKLTRKPKLAESSV